MLIYHFEKYFKFYQGFEDASYLEEDEVKQGYGLPANSTIKKPPLEQCKKDEIPIFINDEWQIVEDNFYRPIHKELNYDAGRKVETFKFFNPYYFDLRFSHGIPQCCNPELVGVRIYQSILIINKKFAQCIELHNMIHRGEGNFFLFVPFETVNVPEPFIFYEYKTEIESILYLMRRVLDSLVQLTDIMVNFTSIIETKKVTFDSIGDLFSSRAKFSEVKSIILGNEIYEKDSTSFLEITNNLFNGYKHTLMNDELANTIGEDYPTIVGFYVKRSNHNNTIQFHNHNAYHIMMGFEDCVKRILRNQQLYKDTIKPNS